MRTAAKLIAAVAVVAMIGTATWTATAGQQKCAVFHFQGQAPLITNDPLSDGYLYSAQGVIVEVAEPAALQLVSQGDIILNVLDGDGVEAGNDAQFNQKLDATMTPIPGSANVFVTTDTGGALYKEIDGDFLSTCP